MKPQANRVVSLILCFTILLSGSTNGQSGDGKQAKETLETYVSVVSKVHPAGGAVFGAMLKMLDFTGYFGKTADPVGEALKAINGRLDEQGRQIAALERDLAELRQEVRGEQNWIRFTRLRDSRATLETITDRLEKRPPDPDTKIELAGDAREVAGRFLDPEMWRWSDKSLKDQSWVDRFDRPEAHKAGEMTDLTFKAMPTLEYYTTAIVVWATAMEHAAGGDAAAIRGQYGSDLEKHINYLTQRPGWDDRSSGEPQTLPEEVKARITGIYLPAKYPEANGVCYVNQIVRDDMRRASTSGEPLVYQAASRNELCNVPAGVRNRPPAAEIAKEREYGLDVMSNLAAILKNLRDKGTVRGAATVTKPVAEPFLGRHKALFEENGFSTKGTVTQYANILYTVSPDGTLTWYRHILKYPDGKGVHSFNPPKVVGSGWADGVRDVMSASLKGIYSLRDDGDLQWSWHEGFSDGTPTFPGGTNRVTTKNMQGFHQVIAQDEGVMYGRLHPNDPGIMWGITANYNNRGTPKTAFSMRLTAQNINFAAFKKIFAGGKGVLYGIGHDGKLYWMKHHRYLSPVPAEWQTMQNLPGMQGQYQQWVAQWSGPVEIQSGVGDAIHAFSPGEGHLYFVLKDGSLAYTRHGAWNTTTGRISNQFLPTIDKPVPIASGWGGYKFAFARITTSDAGSGIRGLDIIVN